MCFEYTEKDGTSGISLPERDSTFGIMVANGEAKFTPNKRDTWPTVDVTDLDRDTFDREGRFELVRVISW